SVSMVDIISPTPVHGRPPQVRFADPEYTVHDYESSVASEKSVINETAPFKTSTDDTSQSSSFKCPTLEGQEDSTKVTRHRPVKMQVDHSCLIDDDGEEFAFAIHAYDIIDSGALLSGIALQAFVPQALEGQELDYASRVARFIIC